MNTGSRLSLTEEVFHSMLSDEMKMNSKRFFTESSIAIQAAKWLSGEDHRKVLDIGAGVGKFCIFGAANTKSEFVGIELRAELVKVSREIAATFGIKNVTLLHGNIANFQFSNFTAFYHYNPFHENLVPFLRMDNTIPLAKQLYRIYTEHTYIQLSLAASGTRLVTFHGSNFEVPLSYIKVEEYDSGRLRLWIKK